MPKTAARSVHFLDPENGELHSYLKGEEIPDKVAAKMDNPAVWEDPDVLTEEEIFAAADANGTVVSEAGEEEPEEPEDNELTNLGLPKLRKEAKARGIEIVSGATREDLIAAITEHDTANS